MLLKPVKRNQSQGAFFFNSLDYQKHLLSFSMQVPQICQDFDQFFPPPGTTWSNPKPWEIAHSALPSPDTPQAVQPALDYYSMFVLLFQEDGTLRYSRMSKQ